MMLRTMQFNDPLPLTLGAKVDVKAPMLATVDIDLTVKWVGDIMDDEVQVSDMAHASTPQTSEKFGRQLFQSGYTPPDPRTYRQLAQQASIAKGQTATGLRMLQAGAERAMRQWLTGDFETPTVYTIDGESGYTKQEYDDFEKRARALGQPYAVLVARTERRVPMHVL